jgi:hypothetical protein
MSGLEILPVMAIAGSALSATGSIMAGNERASAAEFEAGQYRTQEQQARTAAIQDETARRRELTTSMETIQALRAGRGVGASSPTGTAILDNMVGETEDDILTSRANYLTRADLSRRAGELSDRRARTSMLQGYLGAGEAVTSGYMRYAGLGRGGSGGGSSGGMGVRLRGTGSLY